MLEDLTPQEMQGVPGEVGGNEKARWSLISVVQIRENQMFSGLELLRTMRELLALERGKKKPQF